MSDYDSDITADEDASPTIVMNNGSLMTHVGFAGIEYPQAIFETAIASKIIDQKNKSYIGSKLALHKSDKDIKISYPIQNRECVNFDQLEKIWHHTFYNELNIKQVNEHPVLIQEPILNPKNKMFFKNREKMTTILMEKFNVPAMYMGVQAAMALFGVGRRNGLVVDSGYSGTQIVPVYEGYALPYAAVVCNNNGGKHCSEYLKKLLQNKYTDINNKFDINLNNCRLMKEKYGYIAVDYLKEINKAICAKRKWLITCYLRYIDKSYADYTPIQIEKICKNYYGNLAECVRLKHKYKLPDGNIIELTDEHLKCCEILFNPLLMGNNDDGIGKQICTSWNKLDFHHKHDYDMLKNIVLCGGNTMFEGIVDRLYQDIIKSNLLTPQKIHIVAAPERKYSQWIGGSILGSFPLSEFQSLWVTKDEFDSSGPSIVHRKVLI